MSEGKGVVIYNEEGSPLLDLKSVAVEGDRVVIVGALMGSWDTNMYLEADGIKNALGILPLADLVKYAMNNLVDIEVSRR